MASKSGKSRKAGRSKTACQNYKNSGKREISKAKRLLRHLTFKMTGNADLSALKAFEKIEDIYVRQARKKLNSGASLWFAK